MTKILAYDVRTAYAMSGLTPCRCGPEWRRLPGDNDVAGRIGAGPFFALYCEAAKLIVTADMPDNAIDALAEAAERWSNRELGVEFCAAFLSGFDQFELDRFEASTVTEKHAMYEGKVASQMLRAVDLREVGAPC